MPTEIVMLVLAALLAPVQIALFSVFAIGQVGAGYAAGPRDEQKPIGGVAGRLQRALQNHLETLPVFAIAVLVGEVEDAFTPVTAIAAQVYFWARVAYVPAYAFGIPWVRSLIWFVALAAILIIFWQILA